MKRTMYGIAAATLLAAGAGAQDASAARVYGGQPAGTQSQAQFVLSLSDDGTEFDKTTFHLDVTCGEDFRTVDYGTTLAVDQPPESARFGDHYLVGGRVRDGRLSGTIMGFDRVDETTVESMTAILSGTAGRTRASGRIQVKLLRFNSDTGAVVAQCSRNLAWRALRNPGIVYAGATSQDEPVVIELTRDRKRVSHAHVGWLAECSNGMGWTEPHDEFDLQPFRLSPTGRFDRRYAFDFSDYSVTERFRGRVTPRRASGTFRATVTVPGDAGTSTCTSGAVSWSAATG